MSKQLYFPHLVSDPVIQEELRRIGVALDEAGNITFEQLSTEPEFPVPFQPVATNPPYWNPLGKHGDMPYLVWWNPTSSSWQEFGSGGDSDLSNYYTKGEVDNLLAGKINPGDLDDKFSNIGAVLDILTEGLDNAIGDILNLEGKTDSLETLTNAHSLAITDLQNTYGDTVSAAESATAAANAQAAAALAEASAILARAGAEAARDEAVLEKAAAESASSSAANSASAASISASSAATAAGEAETAALASESSRISAEAAANQAVNAAQGGVTIDAAPGALWLFQSDLESWSGSDPLPTWSSNGYLEQASGSDPVLHSPSIAVSGTGYREVVARVRRVSGFSWQGRVRYSTPLHGFSGSHEVVLSDPILINNEWHIVSWNFREVPDWIASIITGLELRLDSPGGDGEYQIDWIGVGNNLASLAQAAATSASNAAASATAAANSATAASNSALSAQSSALGAAGSAGAAATSATSAASSATAAEAAASAANTSKLEAQTARSGAESAQTAAVTAKDEAAGSAAAAATSATNAANSASAAGGSANAAATSASSASTSATNAATSATAAQASQITATTQATNSSNAASAASTSAASAATSASNAAASASAANGSATQAATSASNASTSANQASNSSLSAANAASTASTAATNASASAATATTQASNASASASSAAQSASLAAQHLSAIAAVNPLNTLGEVQGWTVTGGSMNMALVNVGGRNVPVARLISSGDGMFLSDIFTIDPKGIYEVRFSVAKSQSRGQIYLGIYGDPVTNVQGIHNQANTGNPTSNPYWCSASNPPANTWLDAIVYLCGSAVNPGDVPDAIRHAALIVANGDGLKTLETGNKVRLRILNWGNGGTSTTVYATNIFVSRYDNKSSAALKQEQSARASADSSLAQAQVSMQSTLNGHNSSITSLMEVANGLTAKWTLQLNSDGHVTGMQIANGGEGKGEIVMLTDRFAVAQPGSNSLVYPFTVGTVNGVPTVGINGNLFVDGIIVARHISTGAVNPKDHLPEASLGAIIPVEGNTTVQNRIIGGDFGSIRRSPKSKSLSALFDISWRFSFRTFTNTNPKPIVFIDLFLYYRNDNTGVFSDLDARTFSVYAENIDAGPSWSFVYQHSGRIVARVPNISIQATAGSERSNNLFHMQARFRTNTGEVLNAPLEGLQIMGHVTLYENSTFDSAIPFHLANLT